MTAKDYKISFPYGATTYPYSPTRPHRGNDRACPSGTPIVIGTTIIGLTGNTGLSTGAHLHTQAGTDSAVQSTINPTSYEFKPGTVVGVRTTDSGDWGKYVKLKVGTKYIVYAHLSKVNVSVGQVIKGEQMVTSMGLNVIYRFLLGQEPSDYGKATYLGKVSFDEAYRKVLSSDTYKARVKKIKQARGDVNSHLPSDMRS